MSEQVSAVHSFEQNQQLKVSQASAIWNLSMFDGLTDVSNQTHLPLFLKKYSWRYGSEAGVSYNEMLA